MQATSFPYGGFGTEVPFLRPLYLRAAVTEVPQGPRKDRVPVRGPEGHRVIIAATDEGDTFRVLSLSGSVIGRYTAAQACLLLYLSAASALDEGLDEDLADPGVKHVLSEAWFGILGSPLHDGASREYDDHVRALARWTIAELLTVGLVARRFPGGEPSQCAPHVAAERGTVWDGLNRAATMPTATGTRTSVRRMMLWAVLFARVARATVPIGWIRPSAADLVVERFEWDVPDAPYRVTVHRVAVTRVVIPGSLLDVPRKLKGLARRTVASFPGEPLIVAAISDGPVRGARKEQRVLAHSEVKLALPSLDASILEELAIAVRGVPRELPRMPDDPPDTPAEEGRAEAITPTPSEPMPVTPAPAAPPVPQEQVGRFTLSFLQEGMTVMDVSGDWVAGLPDDADVVYRIRRICVAATERGTSWSQLSTPLRVIAGGMAQQKVVGLRRLEGAVGIPKEDPEQA